MTKQTAKERENVDILDNIHYSLTKELTDYVDDITLEEFCKKYTRVCFYANCFYFTREKKKPTVTFQYMQRCKLSGFSSEHSKRPTKHGYYNFWDIRILKRVFPQLIFLQNKEKHWYTEWFDSAEFLRWFPTRNNLIDDILADLD